MRLICPGCGITASAEAWLNDAKARELLVAVARLPQPLPEACLPYLGLFRSETQTLGWKKAVRIVADLAKLVGSGHVQVQGKVARPCPPRIWAEAMDKMLERRERLTRPMPNHNYLREVAHGLAELVDAKGEMQRNEAERSGGPGRVASSSPLAKLMGFKED